jgi:ketosteroid isomerase-like protein
MRRVAGVSCLLTLAALGACQSAPKPLTDADKAMARSMDSAYTAAIAANDTAKMFAHFAPDVIIQGPEMPEIKGLDQIRAAMNGMGGKYTLQLTQETADGMGDFMYTTGRYHYVGMATAAGPAPTEDGKYLEVFRRGSDGNWKLVAQSWNANPAPQPPAPAKAPPARRGRK